AKIPRDWVRGHVVWCVPGTPEAAEACATAALEERATLNKYATVQVWCEGGPNAKPSDVAKPVTAPLEGDVKIVANTEDDCFVVGGAYYVCQRGVWYRSDSGGREGWKPVADVPAALRAVSDATDLSHVDYCRTISLDHDTVTYGVRGAYY